MHGNWNTRQPRNVCIANIHHTLMSCVSAVKKTFSRSKSNETPQSKRYLYSILLFSVQHISTLITSHHQALIKIREEATLTYNTWLINRLRSEAHSVYRCVYWIKAEIVSHKSQYILKCTKNVTAALILCMSKWCQIMLDLLRRPYGDSAGQPCWQNRSTGIDNDIRDIWP